MSEGLDTNPPQEEAPQDAGSEPSKSGLVFDPTSNSYVTPEEFRQMRQDTDPNATK